MNIKGKALMIGAGVAAAIQILFALCGQAASYYQLQSMSILDPATITNPEQVMDSMGIFTIASLLICCIGLLSDVVAGYLYSHFHANEDPLLQVQDGLMGGAVAGLVARIISGLFGICVGLVISQFLLANFYADLGNGASAFGAIGSLIGGGVGGIFSICLYGFIGLFLGGVGGAIGASVRGRK
ncbi:MAG: hypothetical protein KA314_27020 [Chloroflexi bacterium]|nr:hypothetical protein [Chloroflexota bacterium]MBP8059505.1 hypothetical protein [Chloroflexota bacterium]